MKRKLFLTLTLVLLLGVGTAAGACFAGRRTRAGASGEGLSRFASEGEFVEAFKKGKSFFDYPAEGGTLKAASPESALGYAGVPEHSTTNVQVEGVDEADIVKTDGRHIYAASDRGVFILAAYPPESARVVARIEREEGFQPSQLFIDDGLLVVIGSSYAEVPAPEENQLPPCPEGEVTGVEIYDTSRAEDPRLIRSIQYEGSYSTSRKIGKNVHVVLTTYPLYALYDRKGVKSSEIIPQVRDTVEGKASADYRPACSWSEVERAGREGFSSFVSIISLSLKDGRDSLNKRVISGWAENVYASSENLYIASSEYGRLYHSPEVPLIFPPPGPGGAGPEADRKTTIHKFRLGGAETRFLASGEVPGTTLNQFSMDEHDGYLRVATTVDRFSREGSSSTNSVYVLAPDMEITGRLEGLAPGETIYSARFMGDRAYLVTFKQVDPFFVLDLADPESPGVLGALKIPGYSDYLHPFDDNHIIGVGKNAVEAAPEEGGGFAWFQGMKIALFDVTDVSDPKEMFKVEIGDRGTDSYALYDHKAFLFDRKRNLLVLPILLAELTPEQKASPDTQAYDYGMYTFQGAYVYQISLEGGMTLRGRVTHVEDPSKLGEYYYYCDSAETVRRALYIGDFLYTVSGSRVKVNSLQDLSELATVSLD